MIEPSIEALVGKVPHDEVRAKLNEFFQALKRAKDCPEADPDCKEITCLECGGRLETVFGSLPLLVKCTVCGKESFLKTILDSHRF